MTDNVRINATLRCVRVIIFAVKQPLVRVTYSECVFVALVIHHVKRMRLIRLYCYLWPVRLSTIFPYCLINGTILGKT